MIRVLSCTGEIQWWGWDTEEWNQQVIRDKSFQPGRAPASAWPRSFGRTWGVFYLAGSYVCPQSRERIIRQCELVAKAPLLSGLRKEYVHISSTKSHYSYQRALATKELVHNDFFWYELFDYPVPKWDFSNFLISPLVNCPSCKREVVGKEFLHILSPPVRLPQTPAAKARTKNISEAIWAWEDYPIHDIALVFPSDSLLGMHLPWIMGSKERVLAV